MYRLIKGILIGALLGASLVCLDGIVLGALIGAQPSDGVVTSALWWGAYFALGGALVGGLIGALGTILFSRLVLRPPEDDDTNPKR